jgi:hypothetical protein
MPADISATNRLQPRALVLALSVRKGAFCYNGLWSSVGFITSIAKTDLPDDAGGVA